MGFGEKKGKNMGYCMYAILLCCKTLNLEL
jgi:hypothetical protein